jgi:integrase
MPTAVESNERNHVLPFLGDRPVGSIKMSERQAWVRGRSQVLAPSTVEPLFRYVSAVFAAAVVDRALLSNPCAGLTLPSVKRPPVEPLRVELVHALVGELPPRYRALGALVAGARLRPGEAFAVEVDRHVDFLRRTVRVEQQLKLLPGGPPFLAPPKTQASYRTVPLPQYVLAALAAHLAEFPAEPVEIEDRTGPKPKRRLARLVFTSGVGEPIRRTGFSAKVWRPAVARVRKAADKARAEGRSAEALMVPASVRLHDFRHFYASLLTSVARA